ncbi:MAG TPA: VWA domain-containing protein, partial [Thermoleophilia bacterium]|nr:VWA domain-containing protein [Thermoleophilia bacterium]
LSVSADGLAVLSGHPELRPDAYEQARLSTSRSGRLGAGFMTLLRDLLPLVSDDDFQDAASMAEDFDADVDVAIAFLIHAAAIVSRGGMPLLRAYHEGGVALSRVDWRTARGFLEAVGGAAEGMAHGVAAGRAAGRAAGVSAGGRGPRDRDLGAAELRADDLPPLVDVSARAAARSRHAAKGLFRMLPALASDMTVSGVVEWMDEGLRLTQREDDLVLYMSYGPRRRHEAIEVVCRTASFSAYRGRIALILEAFLGRPAIVRSMFDLLDPSSVPSDIPAFSDGGRLYVRPTMACGSLPPFSLYKLVALHSAAHERFTPYDDPGVQGLLAGGEGRGGAPASASAAATTAAAGTGTTAAATAVSDLDRFLFAVAEDFRVDSALLRTLPGLRSDAERVVRDTYARYSGAGAAPLSPASLRAHAAAFRFGVGVLRPTELAKSVENILEPLSAPTSLPEDSLRAARSLEALVGDRLMEFKLADPAEWSAAPGGDVPHPPYYDHLFLGMKIASLSGSSGRSEPGAGLIPGTVVDVPGSLHPSETVDGMSISVRGEQGEDDPFELDVDEADAADAGDADGTVYTYPEWDFQQGGYRPDWCTVRCRAIPGGDPAFVSDTIAHYRGEVHLIRRQFERLNPDRITRFFRQQEGDELDLDALVDALADRAAGAPMSDKVFVRRDKKQRDVAVLFLLDMSDSTDQLVGAGLRVVDVEKQGLVLLSEAVGRLGDRFAIMGFASRGRRRVDVFQVKRFEEDFDRAVAGRISGVRPSGYTRLGAALRHAADQVGRVDAGVRLLVLLSDGRPYDLGYGDLRYAIEDTKAALAEARRSGTKVFCVTVDPEGPTYLENMFGANRYTVIQDVAHLPTRLPRIYRNLTA